MSWIDIEICMRNSNAHYGQNKYSYTHRFRSNRSTRLSIRLLVENFTKYARTNNQQILFFPNFSFFLSLPISYSKNNEKYNIQKQFVSQWMIQFSGSKYQHVKWYPLIMYNTHTHTHINHTSTTHPHTNMYKSTTHSNIQSNDVIVICAFARSSHHSLRSQIRRSIIPLPNLPVEMKRISSLTDHLCHQPITHIHTIKYQPTKTNLPIQTEWN